MTSMGLQENVPLAPLTTIGIGGPARYLLRVHDHTSLLEHFRWANQRHLPCLVLGGGSNLLFDDAGFEGLVLLMELSGVTYEDQGQTVLVEAAAGENWDDLVAQTVDRNLGGLACLSGIPGKVGAAPIQNVGAYGREIADTMVDLTALDLERGETITFTRADCKFGYRDSVFKGAARGRFVVIAVRFRLEKGAPMKPTYPDLARRLSDRPSAQELRETVLAVRRDKSMVVDPKDANSRSCGSFFMNPILDAESYKQFLAREPGQHPSYPTHEGGAKIPAAWLIEQSGFHKGFRHGNVGLSDKHCLALVNRGGGTAAEIRALAREIRDGVHARFGVSLHPEPSLISPKGDIWD